ncbi:MAG TPA: hypothetical protein VFK87_09745, partial [Steroidobacteraceae bacterium]|nr:hypothetical protein [Steroidobacteraceae bacterium]
RRMEFTPGQREQQQLAARNPALRAAANGGHPAIAATPRPGVFAGRGVVAAREARPLPAERPLNARGAAARPTERGGFAQERRSPPQERAFAPQRANPQERAFAPQRPNPQERAFAPQPRAIAPERGLTPQGRGGYAEPRGGGGPPRGGFEPRGQAERRAEPARPAPRGNEREGRGEERQH